jgi:hypothetical protein
MSTASPLAFNSTRALCDGSEARSYGRSNSNAALTVFARLEDDYRPRYLPYGRRRGALKAFVRKASAASLLSQ